MLAVQLKQMSQQDITRPLQQYISSEYSEVEAGNFEVALKSLQQLRLDVSNVRTPSSISRHVLLRYFGQLELTETRFPISETKVKLPFTWYDSFSPRKKVTQYSIKFEQAAVMFNYGALESQAGVHEDRSSVDGLKSACKHFMQAAGAFLYLRDSLGNELLGPRTSDLSPEGLSLLYFLMMAQAQACFYEKSVKDKMKDAIKSKLANQAVEFYQSALEHSRCSSLASILDRTWGVHLDFQTRCLRSASQYWQSKASKSIAEEKGFGYGEEIARLRAAQDEAQGAINLATQQKLPSALSASVQQLKNLVQENLASAMKDNNSIYMETIPKLSDLPPVGKALLVKAIAVSPDEISKERGPDLFDGLIPNSLIQAGSVFSEHLKEIVNQFQNEVQSRNDAARHKLSTLGLPASIEAYDQGIGISDSMWQKIEDCQQKGLLTSLEASIYQNIEEGRRVEGYLREAEGILGQEEVEDNVCRQRYGTSMWSRTASSTLNQSFREDIDRYYKLLREAKQSDLVVKSQVNDNRIKLEALGKPRIEFDKMLPQRDPNSSSVDTSILSQLLVALSSLLDTRNSLLQEFEKSCNSVDIIQILVASKDRLSDDVVAEETAKLENLKTPILETYGHQDNLLEDINQQDEKFKAARKTDEVTVQREQIMQQLNSSTSMYEQLNCSVAEGNKFYVDLVTRTQQLKQTVEDHCSARNLEKREMELNMSQSSQQSSQVLSDAALAQKLSDELNVSTPQPSSQISNDAALAASLAGSHPQEYNHLHAASNGQNVPMAGYPGAIPQSMQGSQVQSQQHQVSSTDMNKTESRKGFFSNLFGGSKSDTPAPNAPPPNSSTPNAPPPPAYNSVVNTSQVPSITHQQPPLQQQHQHYQQQYQQASGYPSASNAHAGSYNFHQSQTNNPNYPASHANNHPYGSQVTQPPSYGANPYQQQQPQYHGYPQNTHTMPPTNISQYQTQNFQYPGGGQYGHQPPPYNQNTGYPTQTNYQYPPHPNQYGNPGQHHPPGSSI